MIEKTYVLANVASHQDLFIDTEGWVVEAHVDREIGMVQFHSQGGGVQYRTSVDDFMHRFKSYRMPSTLSTMKVTGDWVDLDLSFNAWSNGERWNGWHCPYFEFDEAMRMVESGQFGLVYNKTQDRFEAETGDDERPFEYFQPLILNTTQAPKKLYPIGVQSWCWDEFVVEDEE